MSARLVANCRPFCAFCLVCRAPFLCRLLQVIESRLFSRYRYLRFCPPGFDWTAEAILCINVDSLAGG